MSIPSFIIDQIKEYSPFITCSILIWFYLYQGHKNKFPYYREKAIRLKRNLQEVMRDNISIKDKLETFEKIKIESKDFKIFTKMSKVTLFDPYLQITEKNYKDFYNDFLLAINHCIEILDTKRFYKDLS